MKQQISVEKWASIAVCAGAGVLFLRFFAAKLLSACLPFLIAAALTVLISPIARGLSRRIGISEGLCSVILFFLSVLTVLTLGGFAVSRLLREAQGLVSRLLADIGSPSSMISDAVDALRLPETEEGEAFRAQLKTMLTELARNLLGEIASQLPKWAAKVVSRIPSGILFAVVTVLSGIRFCMGGERLRASLLSLLPERRRSLITARRDAFWDLACRYLRTYLLLFALTFIQLLIGFLILGLDYAALPALLIAAVDILPVLGVGTVLLPWAIVELLCRRFYIGFGLIILWLAVTVIRQAVEPHLVGKTLGVHPLLSLATSYIGWKLGGITGLLLGPPLLLLLKSLAETRRKTAK